MTTTKRNCDPLGRSALPQLRIAMALCAAATITGSAWPIQARSVRPSLDTRPLLRDMKQFVIESGRRAQRYQREAMARGQYVGAAFMNFYAVAEMSFESVSDGLRLARRRLEDAVTARSRADAAIAGLEALLGLGQAGLAAYSMVAPVARGIRAPTPGAGAPALATSAGGTRAAIASSLRAEAAAGPLSRPAIVMAVIESGGSSANPAKGTTLPRSLGPPPREGRPAPSPARSFWGPCGRRAIAGGGSRLARSSRSPRASARSSGASGGAPPMTSRVLGPPSPASPAARARARRRPRARRR